MKYRIKELRELEQAATAAPWHGARTPEEYSVWWGPADDPNEYEIACVILSDNPEGFAIGATADDRLPTDKNIADAALIVAARNALPDILDLLEEGATIIEHLRKNIPRGWIVDWEDRINAFLDKLKKEKG